MSDLVQSVLDCCSCFGVFLSGLLLVSTSIAQGTSEPIHTLSAEQKETMATFVLDGRYLLEAGKTGESDLIAPLRAYLASRSADSFNRRQAVMALAKLGDRDQQQAMVCDIFRGSQIEMEQVGIDQVPYVGGCSLLAKA